MKERNNTIQQTRDSILENNNISIIWQLKKQHSNKNQIQCHQ